jgi:transketolase
MTSKLSALANAIRFLSIDMIENAGSGHPGMPMGMADIAMVLFKKHLKFMPTDPLWYNRDRFILSNGHGSALLYSIMYLLGYPEMTIDDLKKFRQMHSKTPGHPEYNPMCGVETTTGPLGQGIANAVGIALAENILRNKYGSDKLNHKTYVFCGDGCLQEGISHEAASLAGHLKLRNLVMVFDSNNITIDGSTSLSTSEDTAMRFKSYGWAVHEFNGHDLDAIDRAFEHTYNADRPVLLIAKTTIGFGSPNKANTAGVHGAPLGAKEAKEVRIELDWSAFEFEVPEMTLKEWRMFYMRNVEEYESSYIKYPEIDYDDIAEDLRKFMESRDNKAESTRESSGKVLEILNSKYDFFIGGSADLTPSNNTKTSRAMSIMPGIFAGNYIHYGIREHAMAAIMNGIALHGPFIPYGGTFLCFSDYMRPAIRLAAIMNLKVIYVMTHDSIGVGEDGPTHQPVEQLASLRAMPNMFVFRPCDAYETAAAWQLALCKVKGPAVIALTRQAVRQINMKNRDCHYGAYMIAGAVLEPDITIFASGSEVDIGLRVFEELTNKHNLKIRLVSVLCLELFWQQEQSYIDDLLNNPSIKVAIEAGVRTHWDRLVSGDNGLFIGLKSFGLSAPQEQIYTEMGITVPLIVEKIINKRKERRAIRNLG